MAANVYECMYLLDTNKVSGDVPAAAKQLQAVLEKHHAEVLASRPWDLEARRLVYPIKKHKRGLYYLAYFRSEGKNLVAINRDYALNEMVLRCLILKVEPKMVDTMLTLAKDENALALQLIHDDAGDDGLGGGGDDRDGHRQRGGGGRRRDDDDKG